MDKVQEEEKDEEEEEIKKLQRKFYLLHFILDVLERSYRPFKYHLSLLPETHNKYKLQIVFLKYKQIYIKRERERERERERKRDSHTINVCMKTSNS